jgi:hypothetical protein
VAQLRRLNCLYIQKEKYFLKITPEVFVGNNDPAPQTQAPVHSKRKVLQKNGKKRKIFSVFGVYDPTPQT